MKYKGIDVSKYQGDINYSKVKNNVDFVIIRIGYGMYDNQKDPKFEANYDGFKNQNVPIGVYLYSYATSIDEAKREADCVINWLGGRTLNLPVYFDIEDRSNSGIDKNTLTKMCEEFCDRIEKAGYWAGIYANKYFYTSKLDMSKLEDKYTIWVAQWNDTNTYSGKYDMWQYTSTGKIPGINGNVDLDYLYRNIFVNVGNSNVALDLPDLSGYNGTSIVDALKMAGYDSSFEARRVLYSKLGFTDTYVGSASQNLSMLNILRGYSDSIYYSTNYKGLSFVDALKSIGVDSSFANRKRIAANNGITNYTGSAIQNIKLLNLLKNGKLKK